MKHLIYIAALVSALMLHGAAYAQGIKIYKTDSTVVEVPFSAIDSIVGIDNFKETEYVDLGLSVKWASANLGAQTPCESGFYFSWGENEEKQTFTDKNCVTAGKKIPDIAGNTCYDAAALLAGDGVRMPTKAEIEELMAGCSVVRTSRNGVCGHLFTSNKNGRSIFIPACGYKDDDKNVSFGISGIYWTSTPVEDSFNTDAFCLSFTPQETRAEAKKRFYGCAIRAVRN